MKKAFSVIALAAVLVLILTGCGSTLSETLNTNNIRGQQTTENDTESGSYNLYLENENLALYINPDTTEIKVVNKADDSEWYSTNSEKSEPAGRALIHLNYINSMGLFSEMNSFENAVADGQYELEMLEDSVAIHYSIGSFSSQVLVPEVITAERFEEICNTFTDEFAEMKFRNYYYYFDINTIESEDLKADYLERYSILADKAMYVINESVITSTNVKKEFAQILKQGNYTLEMYKQDAVNFGGASTEISEPGFNLTLELSLKGSDLVARIANDSVEMYSEYPLSQISVLKYFGSPKKGQAGYFLLPDGSGSVMNFYNGHTDGHEYTVTVYGTGYSLAEKEKTSDYVNASLPVFGINWGSTAVFAEITEGDAVADIKAYSGDSSEVPYAAAQFRFRENYTSQLSSGRQESFTTVQKKRYSGDMEVTYSFLTGDSADYNGMAAFYSNRLFGDKKSDSDGISLTVEYIGMIDKRAQLLGIGYDKKIVLTDFEDAQKCTKELLEAGIDNLNVRLTGWFGGGYAHSSITDLAAEKKLGGSDGFKQLQSKLEDLGVGFYPDADVQYTRDGGIGANSKAIRTISKAVGKTYGFDLASFLRSDVGVIRRVNNLEALIKEIDAYSSFAKENSLDMISLRDIAKSVNADYSDESFTDAKTAVDKTVEKLSELSREAEIMVNGTNAYALGSADICLEAPLTSNEYDSTDMSVPFLMMVLRGHVRYAGEAVNLSGDTENAILRAAQTGADLYYLLAAENSDEVVKSNYADYYSIDYGYHKSQITADVKQYQQDMADTAGQEIKAYYEMASGVTKTVFQNGVTVYVNLNNTDYVAEGQSVPAKAYIVTKG